MPFGRDPDEDKGDDMPNPTPVTGADSGPGQPNLFTPVVLGTYELKNRIVMAPQPAAAFDCAGGCDTPSD